MQQPKIVAIIIGLIVLGGGALFAVTQMGSDRSAMSGDIHVSNENSVIDVSNGKISVKSADGNSIQVEEGSASVDTNMESSKQPPSVVLVLDASGSMNEVVSGGKKIDIAKKSAIDLIKKLDPKTDLHVVLYGHVGSNKESDKKLSCDSIDEVFVGSPQDAKAVSTINGVVAKGWTPITNALAKANDLLEGSSGEKTIILVSDGAESCGGNPVSYATELKGAGVKVNVIGFDVTGTTEAQLKSISVQGGGSYISVKNGSDFSTVVNGSQIKLLAPGVNINVGSDGSVDLQNGASSVKTGASGIDVVTEDGGQIKVDADGSVNINGMSY